ncbi:MAG: C4-type zinc ribbon domain-containing protein [Corynebacterium sp.]|nr:C4-type zinc ribbon domain-containing protein [Corynebacterium sp.]
MKLAPADQKILLELSRTLLRGNSATSAKQLPEEVEFRNKEIEHKRALDAAAAAQMALDDVENDIVRIQEDEQKYRRRASDDKAQLGAEVDPERRKDIQHDLHTAQSRIADLVDELKEAHNQVHALRTNLEVHGARIDESARELDKARRAFEAAQESEAAQPEDRETIIAALRAKLDDDVVAEFDRQRLEDGVGAAAFIQGRTCGGCHIMLPPAERAAINNAPADELPQCSECGCYLIRI